LIKSRVAQLQSRIIGGQVPAWWNELDLAVLIGENIARPETEPKYNVGLSPSRYNRGGVLLPEELRRALEKANREMKKVRSGEGPCFIDIGLWKSGRPKGLLLFPVLAEVKDFASYPKNNEKTRLGQL